MKFPMSTVIVRSSERCRGSVTVSTYAITARIDDRNSFILRTVMPTRRYASMAEAYARITLAIPAPTPRKTHSPTIIKCWYLIPICTQTRLTILCCVYYRLPNYPAALRHSSSNNHGTDTARANYGICIHNNVSIISPRRLSSIPRLSPSSVIWFLDLVIEHERGHSRVCTRDAFPTYNRSRMRTHSSAAEWN